MDAVALVPARAGSRRVPGKNVRALAGHPLIAYSIAAARASGVFDAVVVSTDDPAIAEVAERYGAEVPGLRPADLATATAPDIGWVAHALDLLGRAGRTPERFSILRPTSPFRSAAAIRRAHDTLVARGKGADSIRAVRLCREHPGKMWQLEGDLLRPLLPQPAAGVPLHSRQYADLPPVYVQDSSLEVAWTRVVLDGNTIAGERVLPFEAGHPDGFTIDYPDDWEAAERLVAAGAALPAIDVLPEEVPR